jgi:hypothetical protein
MSLWIIERSGERVRLTFTHEPLAVMPFVQPCGDTEAALETDLEAWVFDEANPWDVVRTPRGTFVRQRAPVQDAPHAGIASTPVPWPGATEAVA